MTRFLIVVLGRMVLFKNEQDDNANLAHLISPNTLNSWLHAKRRIDVAFPP